MTTILDTDVDIFLSGIRLDNDENLVHLRRRDNPNTTWCGGKSKPGTRHSEHLPLGWKKAGRPKLCACGAPICPACMDMARIKKDKGIEV